MLKDLFSNRLFIGALAFFVLCVGGSLLYHQHVKGQAEKALVESEDFLQWWHERNAKEKAVAAEVVEAETDTGGHVHADEGGQGQELPPFEPSEYSPEELRQIFDQFYTQRGLKPPPPGYDYRWARKNVPLLDENGNPILHKIGEPIVELEIRVGFAPTLEEYERLNRLYIEKARAKKKGQVATANEIDAEIEALTASAQRERPFIKRATRLASREEYENDPKKTERVMREVLDAALREYGLEHLILPY
ncbi:hypothetical protein C6499_22845 [Candidatus Poribacteria bacterium]|nr:MAG: hypothetical protein C6499_22845 [Candidatus Poribacteria bacterium]